MLNLTFRFNKLQKNKNKKGGPNWTFMNPLFQTSFEAFELPNVPSLPRTWEVQIAWMVNGDGGWQLIIPYLPSSFCVVGVVVLIDGAPITIVTQHHDVNDLCNMQWHYFPPCFYNSYCCHRTSWCQWPLQHATITHPPLLL